MSVCFVKSDGTQVCVDSYIGLNLLGHAQIDEIPTGSRCGGHGICGADRIKVLKGGEVLSPLTEIEKTHLSLEEIKMGHRLACQTWLNDIQAQVLVELSL